MTSSSSGARITVTGVLGLATQETGDAIQRRLSLLDQPTIIVDLCRMNFMDSTGAAWLISLAKQSMFRGGSTQLQGLSARDLFVLEVSGALNEFEVNHRHQCPNATHAIA